MLPLLGVALTALAASTLAGEGTPTPPGGAPEPGVTLPATSAAVQDPLRTPGGRAQKKFEQAIETFEKAPADIANRSFCLEELKGIRAAYEGYACHHCLRGDIFAAGGRKSEALLAYGAAIDADYYCAPALLRAAELAVSELLHTRNRSAIDVPRIEERLTRAVWLLDPATRDSAAGDSSARGAARIVARSAEAWARDYTGFRSQPGFDVPLYRYYEALYQQGLFHTLLALSDTQPDEQQRHRTRAYEATRLVVAAVRRFPEHSLDRACLLHILTSFETGNLAEAQARAANVLLDPRYAALRIPPQAFRDQVFLQAVAAGNEPLALDRLEGILLPYSEAERLRFVAQNALTFLRMGRDDGGDPLTVSALGEVLTRYAYDIAEVRDEAPGSMIEFGADGAMQDVHLSKMKAARWSGRDAMLPTMFPMQEILPEELRGQFLSPRAASDLLASVSAQKAVKISPAQTHVVLASGAELVFDGSGRPANDETLNFVRRTRAGNLVQKGSPTLDGFRPEISLQVAQETAADGSPRAAVLVQVEEWDPGAFDHASISLRVLDTGGHDVYRAAPAGAKRGWTFSPGGEARVMDADSTALARAQNRRYYTQVVGLGQPVLRPGDRYTVNVQVKPEGSRAVWSVDQTFAFAAPAGASAAGAGTGAGSTGSSSANPGASRSRLRMSDIVVGHSGTAGDEPVLRAPLPDSSGEMAFRVLPNPGARFHGASGGNELTVDFSLHGLGTKASGGSRLAIVEKIITVVPLEYEGGVERTRRLRPDTPALKTYGQEGTTFAGCTLTTENYLSVTSTVERDVTGFDTNAGVSFRLPTTLDISRLRPGSYVCTVTLRDQSEYPPPKATRRFVFEKLAD